MVPKRQNGISCTCTLVCSVLFTSANVQLEITLFLFFIPEFSSIGILENRKMVDPIFNLDLHKTPSERIQRERRVFYSLWRRSDDDTTVWLKRVHNCIHRCEYPSIIMEFLLFDRFMCGLNDNELESLQNVNNSWTLEQLLEYFSDENIGTEHIENSLMVDENVNHNENVSLDWVKFETVG